MAVKLDISTNSVVVYCTECEHWSAFAWTKAEAHDSACRHESLVHPGDDQASTARSLYKTRHAG
jgi:hypothetical protein